MRTIISTVGTSLLTNARRQFPDEKIHEAQLANYLRQADPIQASAETNSLFRLLQEDDRLIFLHSQTEEGRLCAEALVRHYSDGRRQVELQQVPDLTYTESRFKVRGLRSLVATLVDLIRRERRAGRPILINATGGFKAEIAYATLVGLLFDVPVYYIHEAFRDIIEMPPTPIGWDFSLLAEHEEFFEWLAADLRPTGEVDQRLRGLPADVRLLLDEEEGYSFLSPAGEAFYEAYRDQIEGFASVPVFLSEKARCTYDAADPATQALFDRTLRKLRAPALRAAGSDQAGSGNALIYPKGHRDERLFWFQNQEGQLCVCELARHSDHSYEDLLKRGVRREDYRGFEPWRDPQA